MAIKMPIYGPKFYIYTYTQTHLSFNAEFSYIYWTQLKLTQT